MQKVLCTYSPLPVLTSSNPYNTTVKSLTAPTNLVMAIFLEIIVEVI